MSNNDNPARYYPDLNKPEEEVKAKVQKEEEKLGYFAQWKKELDSTPHNYVNPMRQAIQSFLYPIVMGGVTSTLLCESNVWWNLVQRSDSDCHYIFARSGLTYGAASSLFYIVTTPLAWKAIKYGLVSALAELPAAIERRRRCRHATNYFILSAPLVFHLAYCAVTKGEPDKALLAGFGAFWWFGPCYCMDCKQKTESS